MKLLMKEDTLPTTATPPPTPSPPPPSSPSFTTLLGKDRFKLFALAALLLLALWSMFAGSLTLNSSPTNPISIGEIGAIGVSEFDVLEVVEREKVVRHLWNVYTLAAGSIRLPRFWQQAFEAAYESLISDVEAVRDAAVEEIARMSLGAVDLARSMETHVGVRDH